MRFAFCLYNYFPYSGLARDFLRIFLQARAAGHDIDVYVSMWQGEKPPNIQLTILNAKGLTNHSRNAQFHRLFKKAIGGQNYDAIVGFNKMPNLDIYYGADYCYIARAKLRYSPIYRLTSRYHYQTSFERSVFDVQSNTYILSLSAREKSMYQQHYGTPESRFESMPPILDIKRRIETGHAQLRQQKRLELRLSNDDLLLLFIGSGFKIKGLDRAFKALASLPIALKKRTQLLVVGQNKIGGFYRQLNNLGLDKQVRFLGGRTDVPELMLAGDLLIHPAYSELAGAVILEAIISGLPVIATDVCGYAPHIKHANAGVILTSPFIQKELDNSLLKALLAPKAQWRKNGIAYGKNPDLYTMPETAVRSIEKWVQERANAFALPTNISNTMTTPGEAIAETAKRRSASRPYFSYVTMAQRAYQSNEWQKCFAALVEDSYVFEECLKHDNTTTVFLARFKQQQFVVKRYNTKNSWHFTRRFVQTSRGQICYRAAKHYLNAGVQIPQPMGFIQERFLCFKLRSWYIYRHQEGVFLTDYLHDEARLSEQLKSNIATMFNRLAAFSLSHGDMKASNLIVDKAAQVYLIDLDATRCHRRKKNWLRAIHKDWNRLLKNWPVDSQVYRSLQQLKEIFFRQQ